MSPSELEITIEPIRKMLPPDLPLEPGTDFGPFTGRIYGPVLDFWFQREMKLIRAPAYDLLRKAGALSVSVTATNVLDRKRQPVDYLELNLVPRAKLGASRVDRPGAKVCTECGFDSRELPEPLVVKRSSIPESEEIFQLCDAPAVKLAKPAFVNAVRELNLSGLEFTPVEVLD